MKSRNNLRVGDTHQMSCPELIPKTLTSIPEEFGDLVLSLSFFFIAEFTKSNEPFSANDGVFSFMSAAHPIYFGSSFEIV